MSTISRAALGTILFGLLAFGRDHTDFAGSWALQPSQSDFAGQPPMQSGTITIKDRDGITVVERSFTYQDAGSTYFYKDEFHNENGGTIHAAKDLKTKTKWDHDVLRVTTDQAGAVTEEYYSLTPEGMLQVMMRAPNQAPVRLLFTRQ